MIDTLEFSLYNTYYDYNSIKQIFEGKMQFKVNSTYPNGSALTFNYKNYSFTLTQHHLIAKGSLTKLYYDDNLQNLNFSQVQEALTEFETLFGIPFDKAIVTRVDIASSMLMDQLPKLYIDILQAPSGFEADNKRTTKTFKHHATVICIYDKVEQLRIDRYQRAAYNKFKGHNILKYEYRCKSYTFRTLSDGITTFDCLYSPQFYKALLKEWYEGYKLIPKLTLPYASQLNYTSLSAFKESLLKIGINTIGGIEVLMGGLKHIKMPKFVRGAIKRYLESLPKLKPLSPILQKELDDKIDFAYESAMLELQDTL
ncbi:hypothetical protein HDF19_13220 [Mucilaginibacter sp. E4BP6]|uniref:hypothetical protein n=1 Tax=Mucilaginibacter sp. E4BP6 TaxID=2723089 RepID=UPI0015C7C6A0|nr:hypothetical protein [Mucilaginibacter sp. E4BP6]NYE64861.1 hypothetical protein [Mucilaginibacter sp. E4BP6]